VSLWAALVFVGLGALQVRAQDPPPDAEGKDPASSDQGITGDEIPLSEAEPETLDFSGGSAIIPFPFYFYSPETKSGGGIAVTYLTRPEGAGFQAKPSSYSAIVLFTQRKQFVASAGVDLYFDDERYEFLAGADFSRFPDTFYGVGNDTDSDVSEDFTPQTVGARVAVLKEVRSELRVGPQASYIHQEMRTVEPGGMLDSGAVVGSQGGTLVGVGFTATWDGRSHIIYPRSGLYRELRFNLSPRALGSDFSYSEAHLEVRRYFSPSASQVIALRGILSAMTGEPPFQVLAALGGDSIMRGYYQGRFRDRNRYVLEGEYRLGFWKRLGLAVFGGLGDVSRNVDDFRLDELKFIAGYGLRFVVSHTEGVTVRADFGFGDDGSTGFYLGILEAY
jgi:outer membrane protein assembly factor BamA